MVPRVMAQPMTSSLSSRSIVAGHHLVDERLVVLVGGYGEGAAVVGDGGHTAGAVLLAVASAGVRLQKGLQHLILGRGGRGDGVVPGLEHGREHLVEFLGVTVLHWRASCDGRNRGGMGSS